MKTAEYKIAIGKAGIPELESTVSQLMNQGWKPLGGVSFNQGYPYQAMGRVTEKRREKEPEKQRNLGANDAMKRLDQLT